SVPNGAQDSSRRLISGASPSRVCKGPAHREDPTPPRPMSMAIGDKVAQTMPMHAPSAPTTTCPTPEIKPRLHVEADLHHVTRLHDVLLALHADLAPRLGLGHRTCRDELVE